MFGHRFFGASYFGPRYWGDGGDAAPPEPPQPEPEPGRPTGARIRPRFKPREEPEVFHGSVAISGGGDVLVIGHKDAEYPPDDEVLQFFGMIMI